MSDLIFEIYYITSIVCQLPFLKDHYKVSLLNVTLQRIKNEQLQNEHDEVYTINTINQIDNVCSNKFNFKGTILVKYKDGNKEILTTELFQYIVPVKEGHKDNTCNYNICNCEFSIIGDYHCSLGKLIVEIKLHKE